MAARGVVPVAAIVPVFPGGTYRRYRGTISTCHVEEHANGGTNSGLGAHTLFLSPESATFSPRREFAGLVSPVCLSQYGGGTN